MRLHATTLDSRERALHREIREYLDQRLPPGSYPVGLGMGAAFDPAFSRDLGARGYLGMTLPTEYGGGARSAVDRLIVVTELLARGAPVGFHWVADRQTAPGIAEHGTEEQKRYFLPRIAAGTLSFAIGMSEPDAGSDLASLRTRARRDGAGWRVSGTKIWTSYAAEVDYLLALVRTSDERHGGLTQFLIDRRSPGLRVEPVASMDAATHFCEVGFDEVYVPDTRRLGAVGAGWSQNTAELVLERGGVDRWMSPVVVIQRWAAQRARHGGVREREGLATIVARCRALHGMSLSIARMVDSGQHPVTEAAMVKDIATRFEQECVRIIMDTLQRYPDPRSTDPDEALLAAAVLAMPSWTIRGGTTEVLHTIIAKEIRR